MTDTSEQIRANSKLDKIIELLEKIEVNTKKPFGITPAIN